MRVRRASESVAAALIAAPIVKALHLPGINHMMSFGDSYTAVAANGWTPALGLQEILGTDLETHSGDLNWFQYLAATTNASNTWYDFATPGASSDVDRPLTSTTSGKLRLPSLVTQVATFQGHFTPGTSPEVTWEPESTLFSVFIGINDAAFAVWNRQPFSDLLHSRVIGLTAQIGKLHETGARHFLLMNIPPTEHAPWVQVRGPSTIKAFQANNKLWNTALATLASDIPKLFPNATVTLFDTHALFTSIIAAPATYGIAPAVATTFCEAYSTISNDPYISLPQCEEPLHKYFWYDGFHPTWTVQRLMAEGIEAALTPPKEAATKKVKGKSKKGKGKGHRIDAWH